MYTCSFKKNGEQNSDEAGIPHICHDNTGQYFLPSMPESSVLFAQELSRDCGDRPFCELVTKEAIDYDEYVRLSPIS